MELTCVALFDLDETSRQRTEQALSELGLKVYGSGDLASLYRVLDHERTHAVFIRRTSQCAALVDVLLPELRSSYALSIVVESLDCSIEERLQVFIAGADICLDHLYDVRELGAMLCAQARRWPRGGNPGAGLPGAGLPGAGPPAHSAGAHVEATSRSLSIGTNGESARAIATGGLPPMGSASSSYALPSSASTQSEPPLAVWQLLYQGWVLVTPEGNQLSLTGVERSFFLALANDERHELSREVLAREKFNLNFKSISVAISRLRKKVQKVGVRLPLHTVHGMGYVFIGKLSWQDFS